MTCPDAPHRRDRRLDEASRPSLESPRIHLKAASAPPEFLPQRKSTPVLALLGRITIVGFVLAWGVVLLQSMQ